MEVALALLLLMLGSIKGETVSERKKEGFARMMSEFDDTHEKISENENKTLILEEEVEDLKGMLLDYLHYCPDLENPIEGIPANTKPEHEKRTEGSVVNIPCAEGYYQCGSDAVATCASDRTWTVSGASNCVEKTFTKLQPETDTTYAFPCVLPTGAVLIVTGVPTVENAFGLNLYDASGNNILHQSNRFRSAGDYRTIVINTITYGSYDSEYRPSGFPFHVYQDFRLVFEVSGNTFKMFAGDDMLYTFDRLGTKATEISLFGSADFNSVELIYP